MNESKKAQAKIQELRTEIEKLARDLSYREGTRDQLISEIETKRRELIRVQDEVALVERDLAKAEGEVKEKRKELANLLERWVESDDERRKTLNLLKGEEQSIRRQLAARKSELLKLKDLEKKVAEAKQSLAITEKAFEKASKAQEAELKRIAKESASLDKKKKEVSELIARDSTLRTENERALRLIEHYVKRLQRYYDQSSIKINVLEQFKIKRDRK